MPPHAAERSSLSVAEASSVECRLVDHADENAALVAVNLLSKGVA
jgi:hypothetical protein